MSERGYAGTYFLKFFPDFCTGESGGSLGSFFVSASLRAKAAAATLFRLGLSVQTELMNFPSLRAHTKHSRKHTHRRDVTKRTDKSGGLAASQKITAASAHFAVQTSQGWLRG